MENPLISIILPTYNGSNFLAESIQSVIKQTYTNFELIIVDDASTDNTSEIVKSFVKSDPRIHSLKHQSNRKLPAALNSGFSQSKGELLTWTSDDNYYHNNALAVMASFLEENPDIGLVYTDWDLIDNHGKYIKTHTVKAPENLVFGNVVGPSFLYRKKAYELVGDYSEDLLQVEDYDYWMRLSAQFKLSCIHVSIYSYRTHQNRMTGYRSKEASNRFLLAQERNLPKLKWVENNHKADAYIRMAQHAYKNNYYYKFIKFSFMSFMQKPSLIIFLPKHFINKFV